MKMIKLIVTITCSLILQASNMEMLLQLVLGLLLLAANYAPAIAIPSPQCQKQCGNVEILYPFGIGVNCSLSVDFNISCQVQEDIFFEETGGEKSPTDYILKVKGRVLTTRNKKKETKKIREIT